MSPISADGAADCLIDLSKLSVGFSVKVDSPDRLRNLALVVRYFRTFFRNFEIIIVEQSEGEAQCSSLAGDGVKHFLLRTRDCHYKTRNLNFAAKLSGRPYLMMCDADTFLKPQSLRDAMELMEAGADFVSPYNGIFVEVNDSLLSEDLDFRDLLPKLPHFDKLYELRPHRYDYTVARPLYGSVVSDATGGMMMYRREPFFVIGGWNENFISYGYEDMELHARIELLGYKLKRLSNANCYHLPHERQRDSRFNNLQSVNQHEFDRVTNMPAHLLTEYCQRGFRELELDASNEFRLVNTRHRYALERLDKYKQDLSDVSIIFAISRGDAGPIVGFTNILEYIEEHFNDYEIVVVEVGSRKFKYLPNRRNVVYRWLPHGGSIEEAVEFGLRTASREHKDVHTIDGIIDSTSILSRYAQRLDGKSPEALACASAIEAPLSPDREKQVR